MTPFELSCDVLMLTPFTLATRGVAGSWSCSRCGDQHAARSSYSALMRRRSDLEELVAVVCPTCAEQLAPLADAYA